MSNVEGYFRAAAAELLGDKRGEQARLARAAGVHPPYLNAILNGRKPGSDEVRRKIAGAMGYPGRRYEEFLDIGRALVEKRPRPSFAPRLLSADEMSERGFFTVPFSGQMRLAASGGSIPITESADESTIVVHGPSLGRPNFKGLQALLVSDDSMEPLIAAGGVVMVDTCLNNPGLVKDGDLYVLCWDFSEGQCLVKRLRWVEKPKLLSIESIAAVQPPIFKQIKDVTIIGKVIFSWRCHHST